MTDLEYLEAGVLAFMRVLYDGAPKDDYVTKMKTDDADEYRMLCAAVGAAMEAANKRRVQDLLEANNLLLQRARLAEADYVKHVERGSSYALAGRGELQTSTPISEGELLVAYWSRDGQLWFRPTSEFDDGRFQPAKTEVEANG